MIMNISLTPELENYLKQKVQTGMYHSSSEVVREALRLLEEKDSLREIKLQKLRAEIQKGIDSLEGDGGIELDIEKIKTEGRKKLEND
jgi:antitoxin ParD1/3/4